MVYYLLLTLFYLVSFIPFRVLYWLSDATAFLLFHVVRYRRGVVLQNLRNSFPEKQDADIMKIASSFYRNFCDTWVETIKMLTMSKQEMQKRITYDFTVYENIRQAGKPATALIGHMFNWEYLNQGLSFGQPMPLLTVYMPVTSKAFDRIMMKVRGRFGNELIAVNELTQRIIPWRRKQYVIGLVADQSPAHPEGAQWLQFLNQPTAFVTGPERNAQVLGQVPTLIMVEKPQRGYYHYTAFAPELPADAIKRKGAITEVFAAFVEEEVRKAPELYLWSHKRWKHPWKDEYKKNWVDSKCPPPNA